MPAVSEVEESRTHFREIRPEGLIKLHHEREVCV